MFDTTANQRPVENSIGWIADTLLGEVAVTICVIAVAFVGFSMLTGRLSIRKGGQVILGCFVLLGAPFIAASLMGTWQATAQPNARAPFQAYDKLGPREELRASEYRAYSQAEPVPETAE